MGLALATTLGCGIVRVTSEGTHDPRGEPRADTNSRVLDLELAHLLTYFDNVQVFRVEESVHETCDPRTSVGVSEVQCHRILEAVAAPTVGWARSMTSLVVWDSEFAESDPGEFPNPSHAVRFVSSFGAADVMFSMRRKRLAVVSADLPPALGSFAKSYDRILLLLAAAMPADPDLRDLRSLEDSVRADAAEVDDPDQPLALWADCGPPQAFQLYDTEPMPITAPNPAYPEHARREGITGKVVLHVYIDPEGTPCWVRVLKGDPILAEASVEAIRRWRFHPATSRGTPVGVWLEIPMDFKL